MNLPVENTHREIFCIESGQDIFHTENRDTDKIVFIGWISTYRPPSPSLNVITTPLHLQPVSCHDRT